MLYEIGLCVLMSILSESTHRIIGHPVSYLTDSLTALITFLVIIDIVMRSAL